MSDNKIQHEEEIEVNPLTQREHKKQVLWQITVPFVLGALLFLALMVLVITGGDAQITQWGHISLIWLILPSMLFVLIMLAIFGGLLYGVVRLNNALPGIMRKVQGFFWRLKYHVEKVSDKTVEPVIKTESSRAGMRALMNRVRNNR
jgi:hypothetical protein